MEKEKMFPQNQDKLGMRAEASEACMRGDAIHIEDVRIVDECGYIFEGSTNQMEYIEC